MKTKFVLLLTALVLTGCGGGGSSSTPPVSGVTPPPAVITPSVVTPPPPPPPVVVTPTPPAEPTIATCALPAASQPVVLWGQTAMKVICNQVYVEPTLTASEVTYQQQSITYANEKISVLYGSFTAPLPDVILCKTTECRTYFNGTAPAGFLGAGFRMTGATYIAARPSVIMTWSSYPEQGRPTLAHELSHVEFAHRVSGGMGVPAWFDEGQAETVAQSIDCAKYTEKAVADIRSLDGGAQWYAAIADSSQAPKAYCQGRREVEAWLAKNGKDQYLAMLAKIKSRVPFYDAYGPVLTN